MLELIEQSRMAIDELIDVMGRASIEAVLELSAMQVAGPPQQGKPREGDIGWHGTQRGRVPLKERQLRVNKPRLRRKGRGAGKEVPVPVYEALQKETATGERMLQILLNGVSTRRYQRVIPEMADTVGVSRSTVSRETVEASEAALKKKTRASCKIPIQVLLPWRLPGADLFDHHLPVRSRLARHLAPVNSFRRRNTLPSKQVSHAGLPHATQ